MVKQKANRRGRNPQTGESLTIEARRILTFKPSNLLKDAVNTPATKDVAIEDVKYPHQKC